MTLRDEPSPQFPPLAWLGYGVNLTRVNPFDINSVLSSKTQVRIVDVTKDTRFQTVTIGGVEYRIPRIVSASEENQSTGFDKMFTDGTLAVQTVQSDAALAYRLFNVTASNNSFFPLDKSFPTKNEFYFFVNDHDAYSGRLRDYYDFINEEELVMHVSGLAEFDAENAEVVQAYVNFFNTVGSHFVSNTGFGARFQLEVWGSNKYEDVNKNFNRDVTASVKGLNKGGEYDSTVFGEAQYQNFDRISQRIIRIRGGDPILADAVVESPDSTTFRQWTESVEGNPEIVTFKAAEIWALLRDADDKALQNSASHIQKAFEYISSLRQNLQNDKRTWVKFEMQSDWAEFGVLSPSAVVGGGDDDQFLPPQPLILGPPKLRLGASGDSLQHIVVVVEVINDGTPIDIYVGCGSGAAYVTILGRTYATSGGIVHYSGVPVANEPL